MLKFLQARLQQYMNQELPDVQAGFRKGRGTRGQIGNIHWIIEKAREFQKNIYFCFTDYAKAFDCVDHNKVWKILKEMGIPDHLTCLLRNAGMEETQSGIKIAGRNINNLRYADDTALMTESEEELKDLLMKEQSEKAGLKLNIQKTKRPITSWQIDGETVETVADFILGGLQNHCRWWLQPWN